MAEPIPTQHALLSRWRGRPRRACERLVCIAVLSLIVLSTGIQPVRAESSGESSSESSTERPTFESMLTTEDGEDDPDVEHPIPFDDFRLEEAFEDELYRVAILMNAMERYLQGAPLAFTRYGPGLRVETPVLVGVSRPISLLDSIVVGWGFASIRVGF